MPEGCPPLQRETGSETSRPVQSPTAGKEGARTPTQVVSADPGLSHSFHALMSPAPPCCLFRMNETGHTQPGGEDPRDKLSRTLSFLALKWVSGRCSHELPLSYHPHLGPPPLYTAPYLPETLLASSSASSSFSRSACLRALSAAARSWIVVGGRKETCYLPRKGCTPAISTATLP